MDVLDAGVYVGKWEADVGGDVQTVLWGPLAAKEMGFEGWQMQDGGETGFVYHHPHIKLPAGYGTSTLIMVNRLKRAFLTIYFGGYPANLNEAQRRLDAKKIVSAAETFISRLAKTPVRFEFQGEVALVDNINDATIGSAAPQRQIDAAVTAHTEKRFGRRMNGGRTEIEEA
jgi:hypothetical protein